MNKKFFSLPEKKQQIILNAGFRVFSRNEYKKSPMSEIADAAGISKSLLFHYFQNKKELYLYLWKTVSTVTINALNESKCYEQTDFFEALYRGIRARINVLRIYPDLGAFSIKAFYETDPEVYTELQKSIAGYSQFRVQKQALGFDPSKFKEGIDLELMYQDMYWAVEGYIWEKMNMGTLDADEIEKDLLRMIDFWKSIYKKG